MKKNKQVGIGVLVLAILSDVAPVMVSAQQSMPLPQQQMESIVGGLPALTIAACAALLAECLARTDGWWADVLCIALAGACLAL